MYPGIIKDESLLRVPSSGISSLKLITHNPASLHLHPEE